MSALAAQANTRLSVEWRETVPYAEALDLQNECVEARRRGAAPDRLLLLEHPPVITLGRSAKPENLLASKEDLAARGIEVFEIARGGDVTYHAPGQLVGYLILDLKARGEPDVHAFLRGIEDALGEALGALGISTRTLPGMTGLYVDDSAKEIGSPSKLDGSPSKLDGSPSKLDGSPSKLGGTLRKIASIGVGVRHWVTFHGFALNVDLDLSGFDCIVPCGLHQVQMTSIAAEIGNRPPADLSERTRLAVRDAFTQRWP